MKRLLLSLLMCCCMFSACNTIQPADDDMPNKVSIGDDDIPTVGMAPSAVLDAAQAQGAGPAKLIDIAGRLPRLSGDDDLPEINTPDCAAGPFPVELVGCNNANVCIYKFRNTCGRTFWQVVQPDGSSEWHGPQGCPNCSPWGNP